MIRRSSRLVLFDIDRTLMYAGKGGLTGIKAAISEVLGGRNDIEDLNLHGSTFLDIVDQVCKRDSIEFPDQNTLQMFYQRFHDEVAKQLHNDAELLPGVESLLQKLSQEEDVYLGLITGNTTKGSEIKLARFDLNRFFPIGAFGDELRERGKLVMLAVEKAKKHFKIDFELERVYVVGDTPQDISAAIYSKTRSIGVCTGHFGEEELKKCGADLVLPDLGFHKEFFKFVLES